VSIFVAGPVFDPKFGAVPELYRVLEEEAARRGWTVTLPRLEHEVDRLDPTRFTQLISERIREADCVVTVLSPHDQSAPVESAMAAYLEKEQVLVVDGGGHPPRILVGLPGVFEVVGTDDHGTVVEVVESMLRRRKERGWY
jgi:hypothetical protein